MPFFTRFQRASVFLLRGQEKGTKEKATPIQRSPGSATAPALLYHLHPCRRPALRLRNATPGVRRQSIHGLASNWAQSIAPTLRAFPTSRCRCKGGPFTAHPAQPRSDQQHFRAQCLVRREPHSLYFRDDPLNCSIGYFTPFACSFRRTTSSTSIARSWTKYVSRMQRSATSSSILQRASTDRVTRSESGVH